MAPPPHGPLRVLFLLHATNFDRVFENFLRALLERGHAVDVRIDVDKRRPIQGSGLVFDELAAEHANFSFGVAPTRSDSWLPVATQCRLALDYLRYTEPAFKDAKALRERARRRAPAVVRLAMRTPLGRPAPRARAMRSLRALEAAIPVPDLLRSFVAEREPDVVVVSPLVGLGSAQGDYVRTAQALGIPVVLAVASWDNLTNKGRIREVPDLTLVWNAAQVEEAVEFHGLPRERVEETGAHAFDHWFSWRPSTSAEEFATKIGLSAARPLLLYVCSSSFIAREEVSYVREWLRRLRASPFPELRTAAVLIRPHPQHALQWHNTALHDPWAVVWPQGGVAPISDRAKADYFDSLHHCRAIVGINTSAQVEAAILGRPVFTLLDERFRDTQEGTLHFSHLTGNADAGVLTVARGWDEHIAQLAEAMRDPEAKRARLEGFVRSFIRPHGLDVTAAPRAAAAVERAALTASPVPMDESELTRVLEAATPAIVVGSRAHATLKRSLRWPRRFYRRSRIFVGALLGRGPRAVPPTPAPPSTSVTQQQDTSEPAAVASPTLDPQSSSAPSSWARAKGASGQ